MNVYANIYKRTCHLKLATTIPIDKLMTTRQAATMRQGDRDSDRHK